MKNSDQKKCSNIGNRLKKKLMSKSSMIHLEHLTLLITIDEGGGYHIKDVEMNEIMQIIALDLPMECKFGER